MNIYDTQEIMAKEVDLKYCQICFRKYQKSKANMRRPMIMKCKHTICEICFFDIKDKKCPMCRKPYKKEQGIENLLLLEYVQADQNITKIKDKKLKQQKIEIERLRQMNSESQKKIINLISQNDIITEKLNQAFQFIKQKEIQIQKLKSVLQRTNNHIEQKINQQKNLPKPKQLAPPISKKSIKIKPKNLSLAQDDLKTIIPLTTRQREKSYEHLNKKTIDLMNNNEKYRCNLKQQIKILKSQVSQKRLNTTLLNSKISEKQEQN